MKNMVSTRHSAPFTFPRPDVTPKSVKKRHFLCQFTSYKPIFHLYRASRRNGAAYCHKAGFWIGLDRVMDRAAGMKLKSRLIAHPAGSQPDLGPQI